MFLKSRLLYEGNHIVAAELKSLPACYTTQSHTSLQSFRKDRALPSSEWKNEQRDQQTVACWLRLGYCPTLKMEGVHSSEYIILDMSTAE
jgi:hypothetical protein